MHVKSVLFLYIYNLTTRKGVKNKNGNFRKLYKDW